MNEERKRYTAKHGHWWDIWLKGQGTISIRAVTAAEAIEEAGKRWGINPEEMSEASVRLSPL